MFLTLPKRLSIALPKNGTVEDPEDVPASCAKAMEFRYGERQKENCS